MDLTAFVAEQERGFKGKEKVLWNQSQSSHNIGTSGEFFRPGIALTPFNPSNSSMVKISSIKGGNFTSPAISLTKEISIPSTSQSRPLQLVRSEREAITLSLSKNSQQLPARATQSQSSLLKKNSQSQLLDHGIISSDSLSIEIQPSDSLKTANKISQPLMSSQTPMSVNLLSSVEGHSNAENTSYVSELLSLNCTSGVAALNEERELDKERGLIKDLENYGTLISNCENIIPLPDERVCQLQSSTLIPGGSHVLLGDKNNFSPSLVSENCKTLQMNSHGGGSHKECCRKVNDVHFSHASTSNFKSPFGENLQFQPRDENESQIQPLISNYSGSHKPPLLTHQQTLLSICEKGFPPVEICETKSQPPTLTNSIESGPHGCTFVEKIQPMDLFVNKIEPLMEFEGKISQPSHEIILDGLGLSRDGLESSGPNLGEINSFGLKSQNSRDGSFQFPPNLSLSGPGSQNEAFCDTNMEGFGIPRDGLSKLVLFDNNVESSLGPNFLELTNGPSPVLFSQINESALESNEGTKNQAWEFKEVFGPFFVSNQGIFSKRIPDNGVAYQFNLEHGPVDEEGFLGEFYQPPVEIWTVDDIDTVFTPSNSTSYNCSLRK